MSGPVPLFQIVDWDSRYENDRSRTRNNCRFVCLGNDLSSHAMVDLLDHALGPYCHSVFVRLLCLASRQDRPRGGWLSHNGREDGIPLAVQKIGRLIRVEPLYVQITLCVCAAPGVDLIRCVTNPAPAWLGQGDALTLQALHLNDEGESPLSDRVLTADSPAFATEPPAIPNSPELLQLTPPFTADSPPTHLEENRKERITLSGAGETDVDDDGLTAAKRVLGELCQSQFNYRLEQWPADLEEKLRQALPITSDELKLIDWFYRLDSSHRVFDKTMRRQSFPALVSNLRSEIQKVRSVSRDFGLTPTMMIKGNQAEPEGWSELYEAEFPGGDLPDSFWQLTKTMRDLLPGLRAKHARPELQSAT